MTKGLALLELSAQLGNSTETLFIIMDYLGSTDIYPDDPNNLLDEYILFLEGVLGLDKT